MQKQAVDVFVMGLNKNISIIVKVQKPDTIEDAVQFATAEEFEQNSLREIAKFQNLNIKDTKHCFNCNRTGHATMNCYFRNIPINAPIKPQFRIKTESNIRHV